MLAARQKGRFTMLRFNSYTRFLAAALLAAAVSPDVSEASHGRDRRSRADVDIDSLRATVTPARDGWRLEVRYEVEVEDAPRYDRFDLVLALTERGRLLTDRRGRPLTLVVPLDRPSEVDDDELEFEGRASFRLPRGAVYNPKKLKVHAKVVRVRDGRAFDRKSKSVKFQRCYRGPYDREDRRGPRRLPF